MEEKFMYYDSRGDHKITLDRAAPEWCNSDCPEIYVVLDDCPYQVNVNGLCIADDLPEEIMRRFIAFVLASSKAFYRKYPQEKDGPRNGFWENFLRLNSGYTDVILGTVGKVAPEAAL